jgi:exodeoxyribonuclease VII large subunit
MNPKSIVELNRVIQDTLEANLEPVYWVIGELSDFRLAPQGHAYFELVEKQGNQVLGKIKANLWQFTYRTVAARFESVTGSGLKNGMKVLAQVVVNFHPLYGLSVNVKDIDPSFSLGERARLRQETLEKLTQDGLLRLNARHTLPTVIQKIAIISSPSAAGYGDFVNQIESNSESYKIYHKLYPSTMQGNDAVSSIIASLIRIFEELEKTKPDVVIIIRGGGAQLDLDCFDDIRLAIAIAKFPLPVITGIGHERDETIADLIAHTRCKTPTAVAEFILASFREFEENLKLSLTRLDRSTRLQLKNAESRINQIGLQIKSSTTNSLKLAQEQVRTRSAQIHFAGKNLVRVQQTSLDSSEKSMLKAMNQLIRSQEQLLNSKLSLLNQLDPIATLNRGYSRTELNGVPLGLSSPQIGQEIVTHTNNQKIASTITKIEAK